MISIYCSGPHRDLHSFPTRRSSDLKDRVEHRGSLSLSEDERVCPRPTDGRQKKRRVEGAAPRGGRAETDRKSTRLNSSHTVISYAVFCLKKKNLTPRIRTRTAAPGA